MVAAPSDFQVAANKLVATGAFASVGYKYVPEGSGVAVEFNLEDAERNFPCRFENFVWATDDEMLKAIGERVPLFHGRVSESGEMLQTVSDALTAWLTQKGFGGHAIFRIHGEDMGRKLDAVSFFVEGVPMPIRKIELTNAPNLPQADKEAVIKSMLGNDYEATVASEGMRFRLLPLYRKRGYLKADTTAPVLKLMGADPKKPEIALTFAVTEGQQYVLKSFSWTGNSALPPAALEKIMKVKRGVPADAEQLVFDMEAIQRLYGTRGYLTAQVEPKPKLDDQARTVDYELAIKEGALYHMGKLDITGVDDGMRSKLVKNWKMKEGEAYNSEYINDFLHDNAMLVGGKRVKVDVKPTLDLAVNLNVQF